MKIGILLWDYSGIDADALALLEFGKRRGHEMSGFTLEEIEYRGADGRATVLAKGVDVDGYDAVISRANLIGDVWQQDLAATAGLWRDRVERLTMLSNALGPRLFDPVDAWLCGMSKFLMAQRLAEGGFPVPPFRSVSSVEDAAAALADWGDIILKPSYGLRGIDVERVTDLDADRSIVDSQLARYGTVFCQPFYPTQYGELRITVCGEATPINMLKLPAAGSWRCKTLEGASWERFDAPDELIDLSVRAARHQGLTWAGLDILPTPDGYRILEVNMVPGFLAIFGDGPAAEGHAGIFDWIEKRS
jgi:ribosomal protein S6--L-glutamate ligase